jgi:thioredoxin 1
MSNKANFSELINSETPVLIDFHATWCGPCHAMAPILQQLAGEMGEKVKILKIDVDKNRQLAEMYQIQGVPTFMLFRQGEMKWRQAGMVPIHQLRHIVNQYQPEKKPVE